MCSPSELVRSQDGLVEVRAITMKIFDTDNADLGLQKKRLLICMVSGTIRTRGGISLQRDYLSEPNQDPKVRLALHNINSGEFMGDTLELRSRTSLSNKATKQFQQPLK